MSTVEQLPRSVSESNDLLRCRITAGDRDRYAVIFRPVSERVPNAVFIRFALHYYARVLFELSHDLSSVRSLSDAIDSIAQSSLAIDSDLFAIAGIRGSLVNDVRTVAGETRLALRSPTYRSFEVTGDLSGLRGSVLSNSVVAVVEALLPHLSQEAMNTLSPALANMNASYAVTHRHGDPKSLQEVPAIAFMAASFV